MTYSTLSLGGETNDSLRSKSDVAYRALALGVAVAISFEADREEILSWLDTTDIASKLTDRERRFVFSTSPSSKESVNFSWRSEGLCVLLWALGRLENLPPPNEQCSTGALADILPPFADESLDQFLENAQLKPPQELLGAAFSIQELHSLARQRQKEPGYKSEFPAVDIEIIQERHRAINWVVGYCGQEWEYITADT